MSQGAYVLVTNLREPRRLAVGRLGALDLPAGAYAYAGGARTGFAKRAAHHAMRGKPVVAHIDALVEVSDAAGEAMFPGATACDAALRVARIGGAVAIVGFGASGCECLTHLYAFPTATPSAVLAALQAASA